MFRSFVLLVAGLASLSAASLFAQDAILGQKYGRGVHAYFTGDEVKAYEQLTAAIDGGSKDPRAFYFRGLAYLKLGREQEATQDFQKGAEYESRDVNKFYNVSKALERVQGESRTELENYRVEARMAAIEEAERARKARYDAILKEEARVLREQPVQEAVPTPDPTAEPEAQPAADDPFAAPAEKAPKKLANEPAGDVFGEKLADDAEAATPPADEAEGNDPFAAEPAKKAHAVKLVEEEPAAEPAVEVEAEDPFAAEPAKPAKKADAVKPAQEEPVAEPAVEVEAEDPFAAEPAKPAKKTDAVKPAGEEPAAEPAVEAEADDPFDAEPKEKSAAEANKNEKPADKEEAADVANPFLDEAPAEADKPVAEEEPAVEEEPMADENPAADEKADAGDEPAEGEPAKAKKADNKATEEEADSADPFAN